jgi:hypothetical protein
MAGAYLSGAPGNAVPGPFCLSSMRVYLYNSTESMGTQSNHDRWKLGLAPNLAMTPGWAESATLTTSNELALWEIVITSHYPRVVVKDSNWLHN